MPIGTCELGGTVKGRPGMVLMVKFPGVICAAVTVTGWAHWFVAKAKCSGRLQPGVVPPKSTAPGVTEKQPSSPVPRKLTTGAWSPGLLM